MAKILVVDDSVELLEIFSVLLTLKGYEAITVSSKDTAQNALSEFLPDMILLDVVLDGFDGRELCKEIKKRYSKTIPIILISGYPHLLKDYEECNADAVIEKPFDINDVMHQIDFCFTKYQSTPVN